MRITFEIPAEFASALIPAGQDPARVALEAWGLEAFRERRLSEYHLRTLLGFESRWELHALLKEHRVSLYTLEDCEQDLATNEALRKRRQSEIPA